MRPRFSSTDTDQAPLTRSAMRRGPGFTMRIVSNVVALALVAAPTQIVSAAPAKTEKTDTKKKKADAEADADAPEGEATDAETPEPGEGETPVEGEQAAEGEEPAEGEGEGEEAAEGEGEEAAEGEGEEAAEAEAEAEQPAPEPAAAPTQPPPPESFAPDPATDRPEEPMINGKPRKGVGLMIAGGSVLAVGLATTITFGLMTRHCSYDGPLQCKYQDQDDFLIPLGASITLLGTMMLAVGVGYHIQYKRWESWTPQRAEQEKQRKDKRRRGKKTKTALVPNVGRNGAGLTVVGRF